jgi:hypothetical protein
MVFMFDSFRSGTWLLGFMLLIAPAAKMVAEDVEFPAVQAFGAFALTETRGIEPGRWQWRFHVRHANINLTNEDIVATVNMEWTSFTLAGRYGWMDRLTLEGALRFDYSQNGFLDSVIEGFHSALGLPNGGREFSPVNFLEYHIGLFRIDGQGAGPFPSAHAAILWTPWRTEAWSLSLRGGMTVHPGKSTGYRVAGLLPFAGIMLHYHARNWDLAIAGHWRSVKRSDWLRQEPLDGAIYLLDLSLAHKIWRLGIGLKTSPYGPGRIGRDARQLYLGCRLNEWLEIGLYEELFYYTSLADAGFRLSFYVD